MELTEKVKITFEGDDLHIELEDKDQFLDEHGKLMIEYIEEALGDVGVTECNEINGNMHHGGLWIHEGKVYFWVPGVITDLKRDGKATLTSDETMEEYIDTANADHIEFLKWYFSTEDEQEAVRLMYEACGWVVTDIDNFQAYKEIEAKWVYKFRENRKTSPTTMEMVEDTLNYTKVTQQEIIDACETYGYDEMEVRGWMVRGENIPLMLECIFELT